MSFAPRVMLNEADLPATGLIQPASRVTYRLAVARRGAQRRAGAPTSSTGPRPQIKAQHLRGVRVESLESGRPEMRQTLDRAEKFLNLVALLAALLAAVAVGIARATSRSRHLDDCAMLRVLGQSQRTHRAAVPVEFARRRPARQRGRACCSASRCTTSSSGCSPGWSSGAAGRQPVAGAVRRRRGLHVAAGLRPAAGAAAGAGAAAARDPARRGALKPASIAVLAAGALGFVALLLAVGERPQAGPDRGRRLRGGGRAVRAAVLAGGAAAAPRRARGARAALAGAGDAPDRGAAGLRGAAGVGARASACWRWCCWCCCAPT